MQTALLRIAEPFSVNEMFGNDQEVENIIRRAVAGKQPLDRRIDQRRDARYAYPYPLTLVPLEVAQRGDQVKGIPAIGKQVTIRGIDFYTTSPITAKEVVCTFHSPICSYALILELTWCRHNAQGWFENGGRFIEVWNSPASLRA